jgi:hypothetical protein
MRTRASCVRESAFSPLESALLEAQAWEPLVAEAVARALDEVAVDLKLEPLGVFALSQVAPPAEGSSPQLGPGPAGPPQLGPGGPGGPPGPPGPGRG